MTVYHDFLLAQAAVYGEREAVRVDGAARTYPQLVADVLGLAAGLEGIGVGPRDHVATMMDTSSAAVDAWLASSVLGVVEVPINTKYRGDLLAYLIANSEATVVICDDVHLPTLLAIPLPGVRTILVHATGTAASADLGGGPAGPPRGDRPVVRALSALYGGGEPAGAPEDAGLVVLYTSGTTGPSKGVTHSQAATLALARYVGKVVEYDAGDALLNFFPLYHQNARYTGMITALAVGARFQLESRFSTSGFWRMARGDGITAFNYLGSVLTMIHAASEGLSPQEARDHPIRKAYGAGAPQGIWAEFQDRYGIRLHEVYGLTEAPMVTVNVPSQPAPLGSAGRASELFEVAVLDDRGLSLGAGAVGEIAVRPKVPDAFMIGYCNRDADTVRATRDLWFHTGDRGWLSGAGDLYFEERAKDAIRRRGENISAWEVESVLNSHPGVRESAVYGISSGAFDEEVMAAIVPAGDAVDLAAVIEECAPRLPAYAVPRYARALAELPRTDTMKVQKAELRRAGVTADTLDLSGARV